MKELELKDRVGIEMTIEQKKQIERELIGKIIPHSGHTLWEINKKTLAIEEAKYSNDTYVFGGANKKEVDTKDGFVYVSALTKKTALNKFNRGKNGSKEVSNTPLSL